MQPDVWAIVPVKNPVDAKQRLSQVLTQEEREGLFRAMAADVFDALQQATKLAGVLIVTRDDDLATQATDRQFEVFREPSNDGHTSAVNRGIEHLMRRGVEAVLALPADLPTLTGVDVDTLVASLGPSPDVVIAPASDELGSNGMLMSPPNIIELRFGAASFAPHVEKAKAQGVAPRVLHLAGFGLDIDEPADLARFIATAHPGRAYEFICATNIEAKVLGL